ncbi:FBD-associated F-box protein At4g10400 [Linum grandiflorum]
MDLRRSKILEGTGRLTALLTGLLYHNAGVDFSKAAARKRPLIQREEGKLNHYDNGGNMSSSTKRRKIQDRRRIDHDRLSALPDDILHHILSFLGTKSCVKTCILSKRWTSLWKYVHRLTFSEYSFGSYRSFEQHVDRFLFLRSDSSSVTNVAVDFSRADPEKIDLLDRIVKYAASHGVQELFIHPGVGYMQNIFGSSYACLGSLKVLNLEDIQFPEAYDECWSRLQMLELLTLTRCVLNLDGDAFANLPRLESLTMFDCCPPSNGSTGVLKVTGGPNLLHSAIDVSKFTRLEIVAPKLQSFFLMVDDLCKIQDFSNSNLPSLNYASINLFGFNHILRSGFWSSDEYADKRLLEIKQCVNLFKILHNVQALNLFVENLELLIQIVNSKQSSPFKRMKSLKLRCHEGREIFVGDVPDQIAGYFLRGSNKKNRVLLFDHASESAFRIRMKRLAR